MSIIKISDILLTVSVILSFWTVVRFTSDCCFRFDIRKSSKVLLVITFVFLFSSLGYLFYDLFKGGVKFVL